VSDARKTRDDGPVSLLLQHPWNGGCAANLTAGDYVVDTPGHASNSSPLSPVGFLALSNTEVRILFMTSKKGPNIMLVMSNRTRHILHNSQ
jgi:hypothetical protein